MRIDWIVDRCNEVLFGIKAEKDPLESMTAKKLDRDLSEFATHGMLPVLMESLSSVRMADPEKKEVILKWYGAYEQSKKNYRKRLGLMEQLAVQFKNAGLDVMFLKGATTAQLYPDPQLRVFGDIDYYMFGESAKSVQVLKGMGVKTEDYFNHHTQATFNGVLLENHYDFFDRQNHQSNLLLDDELKRLAAMEGHQYPFKFDNPEIDNAYSMTPTMNAIFLMRHMAGHFFSETVALRMLYDWALFLKKCGSEVDWDLVTDLYEKSGMMSFVRMILAILESKLKLPVDTCPIEPLQGATTERIWDSILNPPAPDPYKHYSVKYMLYEAKVFLDNRWKHHVIYPNESYWKLFFVHAGLYLKKKIS